MPRYIVRVNYVLEGGLQNRIEEMVEANTAQEAEAKVRGKLSQSQTKQVFVEVQETSSRKTLCD